MTDSKPSKRPIVRHPGQALAFGLFCTVLYFMTVRGFPDAASMEEIIAGCVLIGAVGFFSWLYWPVSVFFVALVVATLIGSRFWVYDVNWPNAVALAVPSLVPFIFFAVPDIFRWRKNQKSSKAA